MSKSDDKKSEAVPPPPEWLGGFLYQDQDCEEEIPGVPTYIPLDEPKEFRISDDI